MDMNTPNYEKKNPGQNSTASGFSFGRYSVICGVFGLLTLFFTAYGMYLGFFLGTVGLSCAIVERRSGAKLNTKGVVLCSVSILLSIFVFASMVFLYDIIRDPVLGPQFIPLFLETLEKNNLSTSALF